MRYEFNKAKDEDLEATPEPYPEETRRLRPAMKAYLHHRNLDYEVASGNMWYPTDELNDVPRIVIPCVNAYGRPYWQARAMTKDNLRYRSAYGGRFKSIVVVWPHPTLSRGNTVKTAIVVVEGPMCALAAASEGFLSVATMGGMFSGYALKYIDKKMARDIPVIVIPDVDMPEFGVDAIKRFARAGRKAEMRMPEEKDLADMKPAARRRLLRL